MGKISILVLHNDKWLDANSYIDFQIAGLIVDDNVSLMSLRENIVDELSLDLLAMWHLFVSMDHSSNTCYVLELRSDKDVHWYLNLVRDGKSVSFGLIISDCYPGESTSGVLAICDSSDGSHMLMKGCLIFLLCKMSICPICPQILTFMSTRFLVRNLMCRKRLHC